MPACMSGELATLVECFETKFTLEWLLARMSPQVYFQLIAPGELFGTDMACV